MSDLDKAKSLLAGGGYTCVLVKGGEVVTGYKSGVAPLLEFAESGKNFKGFSAADKIAGKAAALIYAYLGVEKVYAEVLSSPAAEVFKTYKIEYSCGDMTDFIINRRGDGPCPMEQTVQGISSPEAAICALKEKLMQMKKGH